MYRFSFVHKLLHCGSEETPPTVLGIMGGIWECLIGPRDSRQSAESYTFWWWKWSADAGNRYAWPHQQIQRVRVQFGYWRSMNMGIEVNCDKHCTNSCQLSCHLSTCTPTVNAHLKWMYVETTSYKSFKRSMNALMAENTEEFHTGQTVSDMATAWPGYESAFSCIALWRIDD